MESGGGKDCRVLDEVGWNRSAQTAPLVAKFVASFVQSAVKRKRRRHINGFCDEYKTQCKISA